MVLCQRVQRKLICTRQPCSCFVLRLRSWKQYDKICTTTFYFIADLDHYPDIMNALLHCTTAKWAILFGSGATLTFKNGQGG